MLYILVFSRFFLEQHLTFKYYSIDKNMIFVRLEPNEDGMILFINCILLNVRVYSSKN